MTKPQFRTPRNITESSIHSPGHKPAVPFLATAAVLGVGLAIIGCSSSSGGIDANHDAVADSLGRSIDKNNDGIADLVDLDGDGTIDGVGVDTDGDGEADAIGLDTDNDGIIDALDRDLDGQPDGQSSAGTGGSGGVVGGSGGSTSGSGGSSASGGQNAASSGCTGAEFCDDFEDGIDSAWLVQKDSTPAPVVDTTKANSGTSSMMVKDSSSQSFLAYPVPGQKFYARAYVNFERATTDVGGHAWFIVAADSVSSGEGHQIRLGASNNHGIHGFPEIDMNLYASGCTGEKTQFSCGGGDGASGWNGNFTDPLGFEADTWYCVEVLYDGPGNEAKVWIDGTEALGLHVTETSMCDSWAPNVTHIKFGAGSNGDDQYVWYDDIAVSTSPIGCN